ncbi:MAG: hypothetical protein JSR51_03140 [Proteobacteria bacterium]|nr:hypothetical protein [Pseudomonadota bacterium]
MYKTYQALTKPSNSLQQLWRYFPISRFREFLNSEELFFCHLPFLSDGLEGTLTRRSRKQLCNWHVSQGNNNLVSIENAVTEYEKLSKQFYVNCWHMNNSESHLMWKAYADRGFAIQTTFERIQASFDMFPGFISGGIVNYIDFERDATALGNVFYHAVTKDLPYRDEKEFRLINWPHDQSNKDLKTEPSGIKVRVDMQMLIECVYINPFESEIPSDLTELLQKKKIKYISSRINHRSP